MYIVLALMCMLLTATYEILNKVIANKEIKSENMFINTYLFMGIFKIILITITVGSEFVFRPLMVLLIIPNVIIAATTTYLYLKSLKKLPISIVAPMYMIYYPISMLFSIGLLKEQVTATQGIAMIVIFVMIFILSISTSRNRLNKGLNKEHFEESHKKFSLHLGSISRGIVYILTAGLLHGVLIILDKNAYNAGLTANEMILFGGFANIIIAFVFYYVLKGASTVRGNKFLYTLTPLMLIAVSAKFLTSITYVSSMKIGNATIVIPIISSSILLVELLSALFLKEKLKKSTYLCIIIFMISVIVLVV